MCSTVGRWVSGARLICRYPSRVIGCVLLWVGCWSANLRSGENQVRATPKYLASPTGGLSKRVPPFSHRRLLSPSPRVVMGKRKRKLSAAEKAAKQKRREEFQTIFVNGKMKRVRRPATIEGMSVDDFVRANADPIFLHQEGLWEYLEADDAPFLPAPLDPPMHTAGREPVEFITTEAGDDLIVAFAISLAEPGEILSLILHRTPKYEGFLPPDERGVSVSHERFRDHDREVATHIVVDGSHVDIATRVRTYRVDISAVNPEEVAEAWSVLRRMHRHGGFRFDLR